MAGRDADVVSNGLRNRVPGAGWVLVVAVAAGLAGLCFLVGLLWALPRVGSAGPPSAPRAAVMPSAVASGAMRADPSAPRRGTPPGDRQSRSPDAAARF